MPLSRFIADIDRLTAEFRSDTPTAAATFDELRMAVARMNEIRRQVDIAGRKLMPAIAIAEMEIVHELVDFSVPEMRPADRFMMNEQYLTGLGEMDEEHRRLIGLGNRVYLLSRGDSVTADQVFAALEELTEHVRAHFATEERLMDEVRFPGAGQHRTIHARMLAYLAEMADLVVAGPLTVAIKLEKFLGSWFIWHMQRDDAELARYWLANTVKAA